MSTSRGRKRPKNRGVSDDVDLRFQIAVDACGPDGSRNEAPGVVAERNNLSYEAVRAIMDKAERHGEIVFINLEYEKKERLDLENRIRTQFGLSDVLVAPGNDQMLSIPSEPRLLDDESRYRRRNIQSEVIHGMSVMLVAYLDALFKIARENNRHRLLGLAWGRTLRIVVDHLRATPRTLDLNGILDVIPIVGTTDALNPATIEAPFIAQGTAEHYGVIPMQFPFPAFVSNNTADVLHKAFPKEFERLHTCDYVLTSLGAIPRGANSYADITLSRNTKMNEWLGNFAAQAGAIGEICGWFFNSRGEEVHMARQSLGLGYAGLQTIATERDPHGGRQVILICGGDRWRCKPLRAALNAKLASVLVTDAVTAKVLVGDIELDA